MKFAFILMIIVWSCQLIAGSRPSVYDSSIFQHEPIKIPYPFSGLQGGKDSLKDEFVELADNSGICDFQELFKSSSDAWPLECQFNLQIFYAVSKAYRFFSSLKAELPPQLYIETHKGDCVAVAGGDHISVCEMDEEKMKTFLPQISPVLFHEVTHIVQDKLHSDYGLPRLTPFREDHATLFSYMLSGQKEFLVEDGVPGMRIYDKEERFGWRAAGQYESLIALTSFLIDVHQLLLKSVLKSEKEKLHSLLASSYIRVFAECGEQDGHQTIIRRFLEKLYSDLSVFPTLKLSRVKNEIALLLKKRSLTLERQEMEGYTAAFAMNGRPVDYSGRYLEKILTPEELSHPEWSFAMSDNVPSIIKIFPLQVVLLPLDYFTDLNTCLSGPVLDPRFETFLRKCMVNIARDGLQFSSGKFLMNAFSVSEANTGISFDFKLNPDCHSVDHAAVAVFDKDDNLLITHPMSFGCL